jgi:hypothetical protein
MRKRRFGTEQIVAISHESDSGGKWSVALWFLEAGQTTDYCSALGWGSSTILVVFDSPYGLGFQPRGP